jgi:hypothetical protein
VLERHACFDQLYHKARGEALFHVENRNGLVVDSGLTPADGHAERITAIHMIEPRRSRSGAGAAHEAMDFANVLRSMK